MNAWHKQETGKGRIPAYASDWAGWAFGNPSRVEWLPDPTLGGMLLPTTVYYYPNAAAANLAPASQLRDIPVFKRTPRRMFQRNIPAPLRNEILAKGIPALSPPLGAGSVAEEVVPPFSPVPNFNMNAPDCRRTDGWPRDANVLPFRDNWLHNDIKNVAYFYTFPLFIKLVDAGGLK